MTSQDKDKQKNLINQQSALHVYLDDLLQEVPDIEEVQPELVQEVKQKSLKVSQVDFQSPSQKNSRQASPQVMDMPVLRGLRQVEIQEPIVETEAKADVETSTEVQAAAGQKTQVETNIPEWAEERFQCLLFKVAGISLAVPLVKLNGVIPWSDEISPMPGHSKTFLGVLRNLDKNVQVMDVAQIVLPEKQQEAALKSPEQRLHNVILVGDGLWGLACDGIGEVITLEPEEVRWRTSQGKLKWLAGTVLQHLCALLEVDVLVSILSSEY